MTRSRVVAAVVSDGERFLVCRRPADKRHGGLWEFPGGKVEPGESDEIAVRRELREELGVDLVRMSPAVFEIADPGSPFTIAFVPVQIAGEPVPHEHSELMWVASGELTTLPLAPSDDAFVDRYLLRRDRVRSGAHADA